MNQDRIQALEALGFEWRLKPGRSKKSVDNNIKSPALEQHEQTTLRNVQAENEHKLGGEECVTTV